MEGKACCDSEAGRGAAEPEQPAAAGPKDSRSYLLPGIPQLSAWWLLYRGVAPFSRAWRDQGRSDDARNLLAPVYGRFIEGFATPDLQAARELLDMPHFQPKILPGRWFVGSFTSIIEPWLECDYRRGAASP